MAPLQGRQYRTVQITRIAKHGNSMCLVFNANVRSLIPWNLGDAVAVRQYGDKLVLDRIDLSNYAKIRTGLPEMRPEDSNG